MNALITNQGQAADKTLGNVQGQTQNQYNNMLGNYNTGVNNNMNNYGGVMSGYQSFLGGGNPTGQAPTSSAPTAGSMGMSGNFTPAPMTGDPGKDAILQVYNKYGVTPGAAGSGLTDLDYWSKVGNDPQYAAGRLSSDLAGNGPDAGGGGSSGANSGGGSAIGGWQNAAQTGLLSDQQKQDLRARATSASRAAYQQAQDNVNQQRGISGGYSPNYNATQANLARNQAYGQSDAATNANASIAQMQQQGQLAGLQGLTGAQLGALSGMTGMYGAQPGLAGTFGNQVLGSNQQALTGSSLQNQLSQILLQAKLGQSSIPGNYQQALGNIGGTLGLAGTLGGFGSGLTGATG